MKKLKRVIIITLFIVLIPIITYAHPGRTDSNGGHWNRSTGTYHYHNGGETIIESFSNSNNDNTEEVISKIETLENKLKEKENVISDLMNINREKDDNIKVLEKQNTKLRNISSIMVFFAFILCIVFYNIGNHERKNKNKI